jgi:hypothetical protein
VRDQLRLSVVHLIGRNLKAMNRRLFLTLSAAHYGAVLTTPAAAAWRPTKQSGCQCSFGGSGIVKPPRILRRSVETTKFLAKAQIQELLVNEHGLIPRAVIEIHY